MNRFNVYRGITMKKLKLLFVFILMSGWCVNAAADESFYCRDSYDIYRNIKYWAAKNITIEDFDYKSNDAQYLKVTDEENNYKPSKSIVNHFNSEFERLIKGAIPFYDTQKGNVDRYATFLNDHGYTINDYLNTWNDLNTWNEWMSNERARRRSLYGSNPAALHCTIRVQNRTFPVLYHVRCNITADEDLRTYGLEKDALGYSTPEYIEGELKTAITEQLDRLAETMKKINSCTKSNN